MAQNMAFSPKFGEQANLDNVSIKDGQLLVTIDSKKIYIDADGQRYLVGEAKDSKNLLKTTLNVMNWERDDQKEYYSQTITILGITGNFPLMVDLITTIDEPLTAQRELKDWAKIVKIQAKENGIIAYCYNAPSGNLNIQLQEI